MLHRLFDSRVCLHTQGLRRNDPTVADEPCFPHSLFGRLVRSLHLVQVGGDGWPYHGNVSVSS